jgi:replicative DNA helicase
MTKPKDRSSKTKPQKPKDDNERLREGKLPADPAEGTGEGVPAIVGRVTGMLEANVAKLSPDAARLIETTAGVLVSAKDDRAAADLVGHAAEAFRVKVQPAPTLRDRVEAAFKVMLRRAHGEEKPVPTRWGRVNEKLRGGFWPGLYTLTSASGMGKTQWAVDVALHAAQSFLEEHVRGEQESAGPDRVVYIALELGDVDLMARIWGLMASRVVAEMRAEGRLEHDIRETGLLGVRWSDLFFGRDSTGKALPEAVLRWVAEDFGPRLAGLPLHIETANAIGWSYTDLRRVAAEHRPRLIVLDYAQLVSSPPDGARREELRETIGNVAKAARDLARRPGGPAILALSSTARSNYGALDGTGDADEVEKGKRRPLGKGDPARLIGLGKESGELEFTADCVLVLGQNPEPEGNETPPGSPRETWLGIAKGRGFARAWVPMTFDGARFETPEDEGAGASMSLAGSVNWRAAMPSKSKRVRTADKGAPNGEEDDA